MNGLLPFDFPNERLVGYNAIVTLLTIPHGHEGGIYRVYRDRSGNCCLLCPLRTQLWHADWKLAVDIGLWVLARFFLLKSKKRSCWWLPLSVWGPLGLIAHPRSR